MAVEAANIVRGSVAASPRLAAAPDRVALQRPGLKRRRLVDVEYLLVRESVGYGLPPHLQLPGPLIGDNGKVVLGGADYFASASVYAVHVGRKERRLVHVEWRCRYRQAQRIAESLDVGVAARRSYPRSG